MLGFNITCNAEHFKDLHLKGTIASQYKHKTDIRAYKKYWETAMIGLALQQGIGLTPKRRVLGVGCGQEVLPYWLAQYVGLSVMTDTYSDPSWQDWSPADLPSNPEKYAPYPYPKERLAVMDVDGRDLSRFAPESFDAVYSTSSIEHFGTLEEIQETARQMARVLKPGGILALTTEFSLEPLEPGRYGWPGTVIFDAQLLDTYIIRPSGLKLVDKPDYRVSKLSRVTSIPLEAVVMLAKKDAVPEPHIVMTYSGYEFVPVMVTLKKAG